MTDETTTTSLKPRQKPLEAAEVDINHRSPFLCDLRIGDGVLSDGIAHVSNIEYLRWVDMAAQLHADSLGYTRAHLVDSGVMWFVARHEIDYMAEVWPGDRLVLATWVRNMKRVKSWRDYVIYRPSDEMIVCRAATLWVLINLATRRPTRIPDEMIRRFDPLHPSKAPSKCTLP